jgi:hypothetical protein
MNDSSSRRQVLLLDCCYGGAFAQGLAKGDEAVGVTEQLQGSGRVVVTASNSLEFAWPEEHGMSVFTSFVVEGLRDGSADLDGDGQITVQELYDFASKRIRRLGAQQTPTLSSVGQEGELVIAHAKRRPRSSTGPTIDLSQYVTIRDSGPEGAVVRLALAVAMEASLHYQGRQERLSARYGYSKAKVLDFGEKDWQAATGAFIATGCKVAEKFGIPRESAWPYKATEGALPEGETWKSMDAVKPRFKARCHPISAYEGIPYHLLHGRPVLTGLTVFRGWFSDEASKTGWIKLSRNQTILGGHAVVIVGYDSAKDALKFANSWGEGWGDSGFGYIARKAVEQALVGRDSDKPAYFAIEVPLDARHCLEG